LPKITAIYPGEEEDREVKVGSDYSFDFEWSSHDVGVMLVKEGESIRAVIPLPGPKIVIVVGEDGDDDA